VLWGLPEWACGLEALHVPLAFHLPGPTPEGQCVRVAVRHHELRARVRAPGRFRPWGATSGGRVGWGGGGVRNYDPSRESVRKAHIRHLGAGITSVPPRR